MTTIDQIKEEAIEDAERMLHSAMAKGYGLKNSFRAAIDAYEKAMWRPIEEAPPHTPILTNCKHGLIEGEYQPEPDGTIEAYYWRDMSWYASHFRPLPEPPEVK